VNIRHCKSNDYQSICDIYNYYIQNTIITFEEILLKPENIEARVQECTQNYPWLVCEDKGELLGYAYANTWQNRSAYRFSLESTIYLKEGKGGRGYGGKLYQALLKELYKLDCHTVLAGISLPNDASIKLHENLGFKKVAHFEEVGKKFSKWVDVAYWQKTISAK